MMTIRSSILTGCPGLSWTSLTIVPPGEGGVSPSAYEEDELNSFAVAAVKVHRISSACTKKMEKMKSEPEKQALEQKANSEMVNAVKNQGLTVNDYRTIATRIKTDHALAEKVKQKIKKVA